MRKTDVLYLKTQRLIAETHRDTEGYTKRHTEKYSQRHTVIQKDTHKETHTHRDTYTELLQRFTLPFATHKNLNKLLLRKYSNIVPT